MSALYDVRPGVRDFTAYVAGLSIDEIRQKYGLSRIIKLASNENPLGVPPLVQKVLRERAAEAFRYPRLGNPELNARIAAHLGVGPERIIAGNGSDELIDLLVRIKARPGQDNVVAFTPCFSMYGMCSRMLGVEFRQAPLRADFTFPFDDLIDTCDENTALVFVTSPDNPSGHAATAEELADLARRLPERALLVIDEAYVEFADDPAKRSLLSRLDEFPNVALTRTFSKAFGLAGLRLGYGVLPAWLAEIARPCQMPFSVNLLATYAGMAALDDKVFLQETLRVTREGREWLTRELTRLSCEPAPSQSSFIMFRPPERPGLDARGVFEALLARGIIVRHLGGFGLADRVRVTVGTRRENETFIAALAEVLHG